MRTKIDVFSGFLGAGKTMLIKKLINEKLSNENMVIIENEFGEVGIDGSILRKSNIEVKEINAGCICCTISGDFKKAIKEVIHEYKPDRIIIEPSGVAKLSEVLAVCKDEELKELVSINMIITVIDVLKFDSYIKNFGEFYKNQIANARTIVLSRTQKASIEKVSKAVERIQSINSAANIVTTNWDEISAQKIIDIAQEDSKQDSLEQVNLIKKPFNKAIIKKGTNHNANEIFQTWGVETPKIISKETLNDILYKIKNDKLYGTVLRAKGIIQSSESSWIQFDYVPEEMEIRATTPDYTGRLCVIGSSLNKENLKNLFLK
jgi:G3E family GTPase